MPAAFFFNGKYRFFLIDNIIDHKKVIQLAALICLQEIFDIKKNVCGYVIAVLDIAFGLTDRDESWHVFFNGG